MSRRPILIVAALIALIPFPVFAQTGGAKPGAPPPASAGHELTFGLGWYDYVEPSDTSISIHGAKFAGEYSGVFSIGGRRHWFVRANARASFGSTNYDGWCGPWLITPNSASPNGYALDIGDYSPCEDSGNPDWYLEGRGLAGRVFAGQRWAWSPEAGIGVRHLSNGLADVGGYRTDKYLYVPMSLTARTTIGSHGVLSLNFEYDHLIRGWQTTYQSKLGGGDVPATATAPAFTINGFTDIAFDQHSGRALRASAKIEMGRRWSVEPYWVYWNVGDSNVNYSAATFTVNGISAQQQLGFYEPRNATSEAGVKFSFRIR
ncbi:MAG TPA: hypothetical protein VN700_09980 [Vicinamibacterales bacterium]|nr:hypothetical protein [Vicinamibacterales bacterium]